MPFQLHWPVVQVQVEAVQAQPGPGQGDDVVPEEPQAKHMNPSTSALIFSP